MKQAESAVTRSAGVLALLALVGAFGLWLFNSAVIANDAELEARTARFLRSRDGVVGFRAYTERKSLFFQALAFSALRRDLSLDASISPINWEYSGSIGRPLWHDLVCFGDKAEAIELSRSKSAQETPALGEESDASRLARVEPYRQIVNQCFRSPGWDGYDSRLARKTLDDWSFLRDSAYVLEADAWPWVAYWLAMGDWPFGFRGFGPGSLRYEADPNNPLRGGDDTIYIQERWLQMRLEDTHGEKELVESLLAQAEQEAFGALKEARSEVIPFLSVPGAPSSVRADDLLMVLGPLLAVVYFLFLVAWTRLENVDGLSRHVEQPAVTAKGFPTYNAPNDPLAASRSGDVGIINIGCRLLWLAFLVAPIALVAIMFAVRGRLWLLLPDPDERIHELSQPWIAQMRYSRSLGWPALALDTLNLVALSLTVICLLKITVSRDTPRPRLPAGARLTLLGLLIAVCVLAGRAGYALHKLGVIGFSNSWDIRHLWSYGLYCASGFLWCWCLAQGLSRGSRAAALVALFGLWSTALIFL